MVDRIYRFHTGNTRDGAGLHEGNILKTHHAKQTSDTASQSPEPEDHWKSTFFRFLADHQAAILGGCVAILVILSVVLIGQRRRARTLQASEILGQAQTIEQLDELIDQHPRTPVVPLALLRSARIHYEHGAFQQALQKYERFLNGHTDHPLAPSAELGRLHCYEVMGRLEEALRGYREFQNAYPANPLFSQAALAEGRSLETLGRFDEARMVYEDYIALNPDSQWAPEFEQALRTLDRMQRIAERELEIF